MLRSRAHEVARRWRALLSLALLLALTIGAGPARASGATALAAGDPPIYGVTIDEVNQLESILGALAALPVRPTTRVYFDVREPASYYASALTQIDSVSSVMGELLDSSDEKSISTEAFQARVESYLHALGSEVGIWEVGNEVNGNWTGSYPTVAAKLTEAYNDVAATGAASALTLYANNFGPNNCGDGPAELTPLQFAEQYVPSQVADGLDYVFLSYYPTECGRREPSSEAVASYMQQLHSVFPNAALGFGEVGLPHAVRRSTLKRAERIMRWAYSLKPGLPYYVGGYFWWYGAEDALHAGAPLAGALREAFEDESEALAPGSPG
ncbi:MAG: hypothetical protein ABSB69_19750 [Solirubrobacteraceae bacterium]